MTRQVEITIDAVDQIPTHEELGHYDVQTMHVDMSGNPVELKLSFGGDEPRASAIRFLTEWYEADPTGNTSEPPEFYLPEEAA